MDKPDKLDQLIAGLSADHQPPPELAEAVKQRIMTEAAETPDAYRMVSEIFRCAFAVCDLFSNPAAVIGKIQIPTP